MNPEKDLDIPESLITELKARDRAPSLISARVDRALAEEAESQFSTRRPAVWRSRPAWYAAAAVAAVALFVFEPQRLIVSDQSGKYADIDGSGRVDIADVLSLARQNHQVSQADLDAFALRIVALNSAGESS